MDASWAEGRAHVIPAARPIIPAKAGIQTPHPIGIPHDKPTRAAAVRPRHSRVGGNPSWLWARE